MSKEKKLVRLNFNVAVFKRANLKCEWCGIACHPRQVIEAFIPRCTADDIYVLADAHHITPREQMPNGGYVASNGICLCSDCHKNAEAALTSGDPDDIMAPARLYEKIGSSFERALYESGRL